MAPRKRVKEESDVEGEQTGIAGPAVVVKREHDEQATRTSKRIKASHPNGDAEAVEGRATTSSGRGKGVVHGDPSASNSNALTPRRRRARNGRSSRASSSARTRETTPANLRVAKQRSLQASVKEEEVDELQDEQSENAMNTDDPGVKEEEATSPAPKVPEPSVEAQPPKEESMTPDPAAVVSQIKKKDKGKQRAVNQDDPDGSIAAADRVQALEAELARLKAELENKSATLDSQTEAFNRVAEAFNCNVCLETLQNPLALACGHVFCQDDLWNWFHRTGGDSDDEDYYSDSESSEDEDIRETVARIRYDVPTSSRHLHRPLPFPNRQRQARIPVVRDHGEDLIPVEDDYNTDDTLSEEGTPPPPTPLAASRNAGVGSSSLPSSRALSMPIAGTSRAAATADAPNTGAVQQGRRVPALSRPRKKNLVCPQCRTAVTIPPFPIFMIRDLNDLLGVHHHGRRASSLERERESNLMDDITWGGLFPRAASAGTSNARAGAPGRREARAEAPAQADAGDAGEEEILAAGRAYASHAQDAETRRVEAEHAEVVRNMRARQLSTLERRIAERDRQDRMRRREGDERTSEQRAADARRHRAQDEQLAELREEVARHRRNATRNLVERDGRGTRRDIMRRGIWDPEDRVRRCVDCNWEIEENRCQHCGVSYDSDSDVNEEDDDAAVDGTTSPRRHAGETSDGDLSDLVDDEGEDDDKGESQGDYAPATGTSGAAEETSDAGEDPILAESLFPSRRRPGGRDHPFSSEEPEPQTEGDILSDAVRRAARQVEAAPVKAEDDSDAESEDLNADAYDSDAEGAMNSSSISGDVNDEGEATQLSHGAVQRNGFSGNVPGRRKKNRYVFDSHDEEEDEGEDEDDGFFVDDAELEYVSRREPDEDESEAESTDKEVRRERREAQRQAKQAARLAQPTGKAGASSDFTDESSSEVSDSEDEDEEEEEDDSAPTSDAPFAAKDEEDIPTLNSDAVRQEMRDRAASAAINRMSAPAQSAPRRAGMSPPTEQQREMEALFTERSNLAIAAYQQRHGIQAAPPASASSSRLEIEAPVARKASSSRKAAAQAAPRRKKVIKESDSEAD